MLLTTGVGSVPFDTPDEAVEHVFREYTLPFFPQVVRAAPAGVVPMAWEVMTPLVADATEADAAAKVEELPGLAAFLARLGGSGAVKTQLVGPETLTRLLGRGDSADAWRWCTLVTEAWVRILRAKTSAALVVIWDEGLLPEAGAAAIQRFRALQTKLARDDVGLGLHTCAPSTVKTLADAFPGAVLSVDAHVSDLLTPAGLRIAAAHARQGGRWIVGAVDTRPEKTPDLAASARIGALVRDFAFALSGGCGTGLRSPAIERDVARALAYALQHPSQRR